MKAAAMFVCGDVTGARHYLAGEAKLTAHGANGEFVMALSNGNGANPMKLFVR
jgi:hypothetical protein